MTLQVKFLTWLLLFGAFFTYHWASESFLPAAFTKSLVNPGVKKASKAQKVNITQTGNLNRLRGFRKPTEKTKKKAEVGGENEKAGRSPLFLVF